MTDEAPKVGLEQVIAEVKVLRLQPGDLLVLKSDRMMTSGTGEEDIQRASASISRFVGFRVSVLVLPEDADVEVLRSGDGSTPLPAQTAMEEALKPKPVQMDTTAYHVLKSKKPGPLSGVIDAVAGVQPGPRGTLVPGSNCGDCCQNPCVCPL